VAQTTASGASITYDAMDDSEVLTLHYSPCPNYAVRSARDDGFIGDSIL